MSGLIQLMNFFIVYAFLGWVVEVIYHATSQGIVVNRGFLNGPICPIYGFGMLLILYLLLPVSENLLVLFIGGMILTTAIELFGGWALERLFHMRWWDYSKEPFNLHGYICLRFSIAWGVGVVFAVKVIHSIVNAISDFVLHTPLKILLIPIFIGFLVDIAATVATILNLQKDLRRLEHLAKEMREFSDSMTDVIGNKALEAEQRRDERKVQIALGKAEMKQFEMERRKMLEEGLKERRAQMEKIRERLYSHRFYGVGRIFDAYPHAILIRRDTALKEFTDKILKM